MDETIFFPNKQTLRANVENVILTMLTSGTSVSVEQSPSKDSDQLHTHTHAELFACTEGAIHLQLQGGIVILHAGDIAIVPPGLLHYMISNPERASWIVIDFLCTARRRTGCADLMRHLSVFFRTEHLLVVRDQPHLCAELSRIAEHTDTTWPALRFCALLAELCTLPQQRIKEEHFDSTLPTLSPIDKSKDLDRIARLGHLVSVYYFMSDLTLARAAELLFVSTRQLERITRQEYGKSFGRLLCETRLRTALAMLTDTSLPIGRIATSVGFPSRAAFCRAFTAKYGETPTEYRQNHTHHRVK